MARILSIKEAAEASGLSVYAIRTGIKDGIFPAFRINGSGGKYFIDYSQFQNAIRDLGNRSVHKGVGYAEAAVIGGVRRIKE